MNKSKNSLVLWASVFFMTMAFVIVGINNSIFLSADDLVYNPLEIHAYDNNLLQDNSDAIALQKGIVPPKYIQQFIVASLMKLGLSWTDTRGLYVLLTILLLPLAITNIVRRMEFKNALLCSTFIFIASINDATSMQILHVPILETTSVCSLFTLSRSLAFLAFSFCFGKDKKWNLALIISALLFAFSPHDGLCAFAVIFVLFVIETIESKKINFSVWKGLSIYVIVALITALPTILTDINLFTKEEFFNEYVNFRYPHMFLLTKHNNWINLPQQILILLFSSIFFWIYNRRNVKSVWHENKIFLTSLLFSISYIVALFILWFFTEQFLINAIPKLSLFKYIPLACFIILLFTKYFDENLNKNNFLIAIYIFIAISFKQALLFFLLPLVIYEFLTFKGWIQNEKGNRNYYLLTAGILLTIWILLTGVYNKSNLSFIFANNLKLLSLLIGTIILHFIFNGKLKINESKKIVVLIIICCLAISISNRFVKENKKLFLTH
jgi:hypothetical protein